MPDLAEFDAVKDARKVGAPLRVDILIETLPDDQAAKLDAACRGGYNRNVIVDVVQGWGHTLSPDSVSKWRLRNGIAE